MKATDALNWVACLAPYLPGGMVVAIAVKSVILEYIEVALGLYIMNDIGVAGSVSKSTVHLLVSW